ncbi:hypothetical protein DPMN_025905 [Dreissena polymorpha]|uniref:Uncharacterized protein n=1 Tax=Dreissena polymorpha TaxID=45954 RepID=A0A9D4LRK1_DREPO|nr:hypothetical protein DPMN_025905 [Dreissena polymorpha]
MLTLLESRSTSDHMVTIVSRSIPNNIGQGLRLMPDHLAAAIRSLPGDNTGHSMTSTSPGNGPVWSPVCGTGDRSGHRSIPPVTRDWSRHRSILPVNTTGHLSTVTGPVTGQYHRSPGT